ncbi:unnamed protein product, partial [Iphiclides podalirius]
MDRLQLSVCIHETALALVREERLDTLRGLITSLLCLNGTNSDASLRPTVAYDMRSVIHVPHMATRHVCH